MSELVQVSQSLSVCKSMGVLVCKSVSVLVCELVWVLVCESTCHCSVCANQCISV